MTDRPSNREDAAWVTIETPFDGAWLRSFLDDVERLYRINPMLVFEEWSALGPDRFRLKAKNLSNGQELEAELATEATADCLVARYSSGLRQSTSFRIENRPDGLANLVVTDDYSGTPQAEREARMDEVDKSLVQWGHALHSYLHKWKRWSWIPGWKFYMRRVWQPMRPMARRIAFILIVITAGEFVLFLFIFAIFSLELHKYIN